LRQPLQKLIKHQALFVVRRFWWGFAAIGALDEEIKVMLCTSLHQSASATLVHFPLTYFLLGCPLI